MLDRAAGGVTVVEMGQPATAVLEAIILGTSWGGADDDFTTHRWSTFGENNADMRFNLGGADAATGIAYDGATIWCAGYSVVPAGDGPEGDGKDPPRGPPRCGPGPLQ